MNTCPSNQERTFRTFRRSCKSKSKCTFISGPLAFIALLRVFQVAFGSIGQVAFLPNDPSLQNFFCPDYKDISATASPPAEAKWAQNKTFVKYRGYHPAPVEDYILNHAHEMGLNISVPEFSITCNIFCNQESTPYFDQLQYFVKELEVYNGIVDSFHLNVPDLRRNLSHSSHATVCAHLKLHPDGLPGLFSNSQQLSLTPSGWVEPLLPSMRHPTFCVEGFSNLMRIDYMVHDFHALCHKLKPMSRTVFVDMGASLSFHTRSPSLELLDLYAKFGIQFDHIYAYELEQQNPGEVFKQVPPEYEAAFHWINLGVSTESDSRQNPFNLLMENYNEDDLIIVKLDLDTPELEKELANYLLVEPRLAKMIDHFYFEQHVRQEELRTSWDTSMPGSVADAMNLFYSIRQQGIASHFWV